MQNKLAVIGHAGPEGDAMTAAHALSALAGLGQATRLEVFRLLVRHQPDGLSAGALAQKIGCPQNTLSNHLSILARAGLVRGSREGRSIIYRVRIDRIRELIEFMVHDCCDGHPELCGLAGTPEGGGCG
jgi:DNA-binding transcriptional ArsR family regulator